MLFRARTALPLLLLSLFSLPARGDYPMPQEVYCHKAGVGAPCGGSGPNAGKCAQSTCFKLVGDEETLFEYKCWVCETPKWLQERKALLAELEAAKVQERRVLLQRGFWALAIACLATPLWYRWRRSRDTSEAPSRPPDE